MLWVTKHLRMRMCKWTPSRAYLSASAPWSASAAGWRIMDAIVGVCIFSAYAYGRHAPSSAYDAPASLIYSTNRSCIILAL